MNNNKRFMAIGVIALLFIVIGFIFSSNDEPPVENAKIPEIPSPWQPTTVPYDSECVGECLENIEEIADIENAHLRGVKITVRPDINDAIAQLGDCLDTIMDCVDEKDDATQTTVCVAQSQCPATCKDAYAKQFNAGMTARQQLDGIETIFLVDAAVCAPREAGAVE
ncbi:MAG: hypothetical protein Q9M20_04310 [Mariprofundaceae bacterium]|nr:hypothetical protein [Mariprofundaceae bacterium]